MRERKYLNDYAVRSEVTESGKIRSYGEYIGPYFRILTPRQEIVSITRRIGIMCILAWALFLASLSVLSLSTTRFYVLFPYAILVITMSSLGVSAVRIYRYKDKIIRSDADLLKNRFPIMSFIGMIMSGVAFIGAAVSAVIYFRLLRWGDALFFVSCLFAFLFHLYCFSLRGKVIPEMTSERNDD